MSPLPWMVTTWCRRSYRVGVYRIIYELRDDETLRVVAIRHRGDAYGTDPR
ncbi:MAG: type II toxin-antitoxin system RelE/ParE family toxin [Nitriliruptoraceae bacterium]